jgi:pimeloyl-ACP methyl ester carboxylesterase
MAQSTSQANQPAIVIVPGSFSPPSLYTGVSECLQKDGYETIIGTLESASREPPAPAATMEDDAAAFHAIIEKLANQGKDVVIVAHSYGGIVATQAAEGLAKTDREAGGKKGGIVRVVYLSSVVPEAGKSLQDVGGGTFPDYLSVKVSILAPTVGLHVSDYNPKIGRLHGHGRRAKWKSGIFGPAARRRSKMGVKSDASIRR